MDKLNINGIEIDVEKKKIKHMYIRVTPPAGRVKITAPVSVTAAAISRFAFSRLDWIEKQRREMADWPQSQEPRYITGEDYYLWGRRYRLEVAYSSARNAVAVEGLSLRLRVRPDSTPEQRGRVLDRWRRRLLQAAVPPILARCEQLVGVQADEWRIRNMRTRWGTCHVQKKRIWLNLQLTQRAPECLEYVIIHELVHLLEKRHNAVFYAYLDRFCPDWRAIQKQLSRPVTD